MTKLISTFITFFGYEQINLRRAQLCSQEPLLQATIGQLAIEQTLITSLFICLLVRLWFYMALLVDMIL
jgi:hypothetical protein